MDLFLRRERPHVVISFGPDGRTGHPDHVAAGLLAEEAFERARDPRMYREHRDRGLACWQPLRLLHTAVARSVAHRLGWRHPSYPDDELVAINAASVLERKRLAAAGAHASQWALSPFNLSRGWEPHEVEHNRLARNAGPPLPPGTGDLFAGIE